MIAGRTSSWEPGWTNGDCGLTPTAYRLGSLGGRGGSEGAAKRVKVRGSRAYTRNVKVPRCLIGVCLRMVLIRQFIDVAFAQEE